MGIITIESPIQTGQHPGRRRPAGQLQWEPTSPGSFEGEDAEVRAALVVSSILGLTIARHFLKLEAFESISREALTSTANAWIAAVSAPSTASADPASFTSAQWAE